MDQSEDDDMDKQKRAEVFNSMDDLAFFLRSHPRLAKYHLVLVYDDYDPRSLFTVFP